MDIAPATNTLAAPDAALVERARDGDRDAFTALIDSRLATTYRTALAFLSNETDARDATEEIFVRAWGDLPGLREPDGFGAWFAGIVDETCRTAGHERRHRRGGSTSTDGTATTGTLRQEILARVATTGQRSGPRVARALPNPIPKNRGARLGLAILAVAALSVPVAILISQRLQGPQTPFRTGLVAFIRDGDVHLGNPDGSEAAVVVHQDGIALSTVVWSPDGRRVAVDGDSGAIVLDTATGATRYVGGRDPVWSPDGKRLAVLDDGTDDSGTRLRVLDVEAGTETTHPFNATGDMAWSPDGRWIVAAGTTDDRGSGRFNALVRLDVSTGDVQSLDPSTTVRGSMRQPAWAPDSFRIAFSRTTTTGYGCDGTALCGSDVYTADPDGTGVVQLNDPKTDADQPAWSPNGEWVAFRQVAGDASTPRDDATDPDANVGLIVVSPDLTAFRAVDAKGVQAFAWSPEGDRLRYVRSEGRGRPPSLWEATLDGETSVARPLGLSIDPAAPYYYARSGFGVAWQPLARAASMPTVPSAKPSTPTAATPIATPPVAPAADPSATWPTLAIESTDGCAPPTLIATRDGSATPVGTGCEGTQSATAYAWSPTGTHHARLDDRGQLSIMDLDGMWLANLGGLSGLTSFSWSPGGSWLSVTGTIDRIIRVDGTDLRDLPGPPSWSPDDRRMSISRPDGTLLVGQGDGTGLTSVGSFPQYVVWSRDGSRFAFTRSGDAWTAAADGTGIRNATAFPLGGTNNIAWSPDGRWLSVTATHGAWLMRADGSERRGLVFGPSTSIGGLTWSPDASRLAVEAYADDQSGQGISNYLLNVDGAATVRLDAVTGLIWSPDGRYIAATDMVSSTGGGFESGNLVLMNGDGSGRHELPVNANGNWPIWVQGR